MNMRLIFTLFVAILCLTSDVRVATAAATSSGMLACDVDSITRGARLISPDKDWPSQIEGTLSQTTQTLNFGVSSETMATMLANAPTVVDPHLTDNPAARFLFIVLQGGGNDIVAGTSAAAIYTTACAYTAARLAAGWQQVFTTTIMPSGSFSGAQDAVRVSYNALIIANASSCAYTLIDVTTTTQLSDSTNRNYFQTDGHLTPLGAYYYASAIKGGANPFVH